MILWAWIYSKPSINCLKYLWAYGIARWPSIDFSINNCTEKGQYSITVYVYIWNHKEKKKLKIIFLYLLQ